MKQEGEKELYMIEEKPLKSLNIYLSLRRTQQTQQVIYQIKKIEGNIIYFKSNTPRVKTQMTYKMIDWLKESL